MIAIYLFFTFRFRYFKQSEAYLLFSEICGKDTAFTLITSVFFTLGYLFVSLISGLKTHKNGG